ncbi:MAG: hypothetical protein AAGG56_17450 [Pseudomonadota bacterium]
MDSLLSSLRNWAMSIWSEASNASGSSERAEHDRMGLNRVKTILAWKKLTTPEGGSQRLLFFSENR